MTRPAFGSRHPPCGRVRPTPSEPSSPVCAPPPSRPAPGVHGPGMAPVPQRGQRTCGPRQEEARQGNAVDLAKTSEPVGAWRLRSNRGDFGTAGPAPAFRAQAGAPIPREQRTPGRRTDAGSATAQPRAPRPESAAPGPDANTVPTWTRRRTVERSEREERKADASGGPPQGSSNGQAAVLWWWRVNSDLPLARHPEGCQTAANPSRESALTGRPPPGRTRVCRPRGRSEQPRVRAAAPRRAGS
jgi:hypothetical protein